MSGPDGHQRAPPPSLALSVLDAEVLSAAEAGQLDQLAAALEAGGSADACAWGSADTALLLATRGGHADCCTLLLRHGADAGRQGSRGETAVAAAVLAGDRRVLEAVLPAITDLSAATDAGLSAFQLACRCGRPWALRALLQCQRELLQGRSVDSMPSMGSATSTAAGTAAGAAAAPANPAPGDVARQAAGRALVLAMYSAVAAGAASCLQLLLEEPLAREAYAALFAQESPHQQQQPPEQQLSGEPQRGSRLQQQQGPQQAQQQAARLQQLQEGLRFLLDPVAVGPASAAAASFLWHTGGLPSHLAAATDRADCLHLLLSSGLCSGSDATAEGFTPLMLAASADAAASAAVLLGRGMAGPGGAGLEARNSAGRTPLFLAAVGGSPGVLAQLIGAGADVNATEAARQYTPLIAAVSRAAALEAACQPRAEAFAGCVRLLLGAGSDVRAAAKGGLTALHAAAEGGSTALLGLLLQHGAEADAEDAAGRTALAGAAAGRAPHPACVLLLLEHGASVGSPDLARSVLSCLLPSERGGPGSGEVLTVWQLLARLRAPQLKALTACPLFFDLAHTEPLQGGLPPAAVGAMLELAAEGCSNLLYNASPADSASHGRRPAYLFELLRRLAAASAAAAAAGASGVAGGSSGQGIGGAEAAGGGGAWAALRAAVAGSPHVAKLLGLWASAQALLSYAACIARCRNVPPPDRQALSCRVGHLLSAYHSLAGLCSRLSLSLSAGLDHPHLPLAEAGAAPPGPMAQLRAALRAGPGHGEQAGAAAAEQEEEEEQAFELCLELAAGAGASGGGMGGASGSRASGSSGGEAAATQGGQDADAADDDADSKPADMEGVEEAGASQPSNALHSTQLSAPTQHLPDGLPDPPASARAVAASAAPVQPPPVPAPAVTLAAPRQQPEAAAEAEPAIAAALEPFGPLLGDLLGAVAEEPHLRAWTFLLEYGLVASLACKQRLLDGLIAAWPRRLDAQLPLTSGRARVLQRACTAVEEWRATTAGGSSGGSSGAALWHGLKVSFEEEHGVGDGVRREWFRLLAAELTDPHTGLFESHDGGASFAPAPHASVQTDPGGGCAPPGAGPGHLPKFELVGGLLGAALLHGCTLPGLRLTAATWRAALRPLGEQTTVGRQQVSSVSADPSPGSTGSSHWQLEAELAASDPRLHRSLQQLRGMAPAEVAALGLSFEVQDALGRSAELVPGGAGLLVTGASLERYIATLVRYKQVDSIAAEAAALGRGLRAALGGDAADALARCFSPPELNTLIGGLDGIDVEDWRAQAKYEGGCERAPQVAWLWAAVGGMAPPRRAALLAFVTGASSLPAGGFGALRGFNGAAHPFTICVVAVEGDERLPRASTCFNTLFLPRYSSAAVLETRLAAALDGGGAFDEAVIRR